MASGGGGENAVGGNGGRIGARTAPARSSVVAATATAATAEMSTPDNHRSRRRADGKAEMKGRGLL